MTKSLVKPTNILLTLKENCENNVTIKEVYNVIYLYWRSNRGGRPELQQLMKLIDHDNYIH